MPEKDDLDLLLDSALSTYADPGPVSGLEQRILSRIAESSINVPPRLASSEFAGLWAALRRRWRWAALAAAVPLAANLILLTILPHHPSYSTAGNPQIQSRSQQPAIVTAPFHPPNAQNQTPGREGMPPRLHAPKASAAIPKLEVFPTPEPLTPQEQALVQFAANAPENERESLLKAQNKVDTPITIAAIHIPPLTAPDQGTR